MDINEYRRISLVMLDLLALALRVKTSSQIKLDPADFDKLYKVAANNGLCAMTAFALKKAGFVCEDFNIAYAKAQRNNILYDREYLHLCQKLDAANIKYLPLKGILLKHIYPTPCLREMTDIDMLFLESPDKVKSVMQQSGYTCTQYDKANHDVYQKPPFFCVEMHRSLIDGSLFPVLSQFFDSLSYAPVEGGSFRMEMTKEQMYLHLVAHAYIHDTLAGTGLRTLLDIYLYLKAYSARMDMAGVHRNLESIGLSEYESSLRNLSKKLFLYDTMTAEEKEILDAYIFAGKYGNQDRFIHNRMERIMKSSDKPTKLRYIAKRLSYDQRNIHNSPFYTKHPKLAPLLYVTRPIKAVVTRPKSVIKELKQLNKKHKS